jgi:hypothetical protein
MHSPGPAFRWRFVRLRAALVEAEARLEWAQASGGDEVRIKLCGELLEQARSAVESAGLWDADAREYFAWDCLAQFDRQMLHLVGDKDLMSIWLSLVAEAQEKCSGHRKKAIADIAEQVKTVGPTRSAVEAVMQHLQTTSQNLYYKIDRLQRQIFWAGALLLALILYVLFAASFNLFDAYGPDFGSKIALGTIVGWVGGVLSVAFTVTNANEKTKIPKLVSSFRVSLARPLIGAALALPVVLVVDSGLITIGKIDSKWVVAIACFLAGFSERWFLGVMAGIEKQAAPPSKKEPVDGP